MRGLGGSKNWKVSFIAQSDNISIKILMYAVNSRYTHKLHDAEDCAPPLCSPGSSAGLCLSNVGAIVLSSYSALLQLPITIAWGKTLVVVFVGICHLKLQLFVMVAV